MIAPMRLHHFHATVAILFLLFAGLLIQPLQVDASCRAVYAGDTTLSLTSSLPQTVPGASVDFEARATSASAWAQSYLLAIEVASPSGSIIDRFIAPTPLKNDPVHFSWTVPSALAPGIYSVTATAVPPSVSYADAYSDLSLPHASASIAITNDPSYLYVAGFDASHGLMRGASPGQIRASIVNDSDIPYRGMLTWRVWSASTPIGSDPIITAHSDAEAHPHSATEIDYTVPNAGRGTFYVEARTTDGQFMSIAHGWLTDGVFSEIQSCAGTSVTNTQLFRALGLIGVIIIGIFVWASVQNKPFLRTKRKSSKH